MTWGITRLRAEQLHVCIEETHSDERHRAGRPYPGAVETVNAWHEAGHFIHITSHRAERCPRRDRALAATQIGLRYDELLLLLRQGHPLRRDRHRRADRRQPGQPRRAHGARASRRPRSSTRGTATSARRRTIVCADDWPELAPRSSSTAVAWRVTARARRLSADARARPSPPTCATCLPGPRARAPGRPTGAARSASRALLDRTLVEFLYHLWFRCEVEGIENVPAEGGALLVSNHAGALPPDAAMIAKAIKEEHPRPRPLHLTVEHFFKGYPGFSMLLPKIGARARPPGQRPPPAVRRGAARARLPRGPQGHREALQGPLPAAALRPRRVRRGGDARPRADRPVAVVGAEEAAPVFAQLPPLQRLTGPDVLPDHADVPALRPARDARLPAGEVPHPLPAAGAHRRHGRRAVGGQGPRADRRPRHPRDDPGGAVRHGRRAAQSVWFG